MSEPHLKLVLLWHMHQPDFRDQHTGEFLQPWVYLHALKDYSDMAAHLEAHPRIKAVVNLVPILLEQLEDYAGQFAGGQIRDPLLRLLTRATLDDISAPERTLILDQCFRANHVKMIEPFTPYKRLRDLYKYVVREGADMAQYLSGQYLADLLTWYHLSWTGETVRREHELIVRLMTHGEGFSHAERMEMFALIGKVVSGTLARYRRLAESGQIELSTTPYYHPIAPLLLEFDSARVAMRDAPFPVATVYPGGRARASWHLGEALRTHAERFGSSPAGIWPAEGAVSQAFCRLLVEHGVRWTASGEAVLANSLARAGRAPGTRADFLYRPYVFDSKQGKLTAFFRDDRLSDLIGFQYKGWHGQDASQHFVAQVDAILAQSPPGEAPVVSVILDGENAWEYYPYNAYYFLDDLYRSLEVHPTIRTATYSELLGDADCARIAQPLPELVTGSWVYGNLSTWIGSHDKNRAWDLLVTAKQCYDLVVQSGRLTPDEAAAAARQLATCEGSDWFWWFGDYNPHESVERFDRLFRANLASLYRLLKLEPPLPLHEPISFGALEAHTDGAMRRAA
jgi:alpha-amylase/alpha-mannosidase (GH57 family)